MPRIAQLSVIALFVLALTASVATMLERLDEIQIRIGK